jgi:hypothetical protein
MDHRVIVPKKGPEAKLQFDIVNYLRMREWFVIQTHGNLYQSGLPDLFACHSKFGQRWIEVKNPLHFRFTAAQLDVFPKLCANGSGVWVLVAATDAEYMKLFKMYNWSLYLL